MRSYVVYFHRNPETKTIFYVGIGNNKRPFQFQDRNIFWKKYVLKYGNPVVDVIKIGVSKEEAIEAELHFISVLGRRGIDKNGILVNRTIGGDGVKGVPMSDITRKKLSLINKGKKLSVERRLKISNGQRGRKLTEEWRKSLSESKMGSKNPFYGKTFSREHREKLSGRRGPLHPRYGKKNTEESKIKRRATVGDRFKRGGHPYAHKVIHEATGGIWPCVKDAWELSGLRMTYISFARCLRNERKNKTGYKLLINGES